MIESFPGDVIKTNKVGKNGVYPWLLVTGKGTDDIVTVSDGSESWNVSWWTIYTRLPKEARKTHSTQFDT